MGMVVIVVSGFAVVVGYRAGAEKHQPANVERLKIFDRFADKRQYQVRQQRHDQAGGSHKLVGIHFPGIVNLG